VTPGGVYVGLDIGSSSVKAIALDAEDGAVRAIGRGSFEIDRPTAGGWEFDPEEIFRAAQDSIRDLPDEARRSARAVGVVGQMCGLVALDRDRAPVGPALPIFDDRSVAESQALAAGHGPHLRSHECNDALPVYTLPKLLWLRSAQPERFDQVDLVVLPKDYVRGRLTGEWATDPSDASGTLAFDQTAGSWDEELLAELGLPAEHWPQIAASASSAGGLDASTASQLGLPAGIPVATGASDMAAVMLGVGAATPEEVIISFGTAAHVIAPTHDLSQDIWPVQQYTAAAGNGWFRFGAVYSGSICAQWLLGLLDEEPHYELFDEAPRSEDSDDLFFMPYLAGAGAPHEVPEAAGAFVGLRLAHGRTDLARAVLEGLCFEVAEIYETQDPERSKEIHVTGGGARLGPIVQLMADLLGREVKLSASLEAAGIGAARLAAAADGADDALPLPPPTIVAPRAPRTALLATRRRRYSAMSAAIRDLHRSTT
jgi:xylulokinase